MPAVHLPRGPYSESSPPQPSSLIYTSDSPTPKPTQSQYLLNVQTAALCRSELTWPEVLNNSRSSPPIPAYDICGIVLSTPVTDQNSIDGPKFKVGDEVFALLDVNRNGGASDCTVAEEGELAFKPKNISASESASIPLSALTAWQALFRYGNLKRVADECGHLSDGDDNAESGGELIDEEKKKKKRDLEHGRQRERKPIRVLVTNASGGVGVQVIQLLRSHTLFGNQRFWICGTCSHRNAAFVRDELRADEVLDYTVEPDISQAFSSRAWEPVDFVLDCIGGDALKQAHSPSVSRDGASVITIAHPAPEQWGDLGIQKRGLNSKFFIVVPSGEQLQKIAVLVERGELRGIVEKVFDLHQAREAMELVESQRVRGKVVLRVNSSTN